jgi:Tfp pilus assembly protein PilX
MSTDDNKSRKNEKGVALVTTLLFLVVLGLLSTTLVFTVQNEVQSSTAYKYNQQAFYVADAGIQKVLQWYRNSYTPHLPATDYDRTKYPVEYNSSPVLLAGQTGYSSAYPESTCISAFTTAFGNKSLQANANNTGAYAINATLLKYAPTTFFDLSTFTRYNSAYERWRINSIGYWGNVNNPLAVSRIEAIIENSGNAFFDRGLWGIDELVAGGDVTVDSFDPSKGVWDAITNNGYRGSIGSNGVITSNGNITVQGDIGYGPAGDYVVNGGASDVSGSVLQMPQEKYFPPIPSFSTANGNTNINNSTVTIGGGADLASCNQLGNYRIGANATLVLSGGTYCFKGITIAALGTVQVESTATILVSDTLALGGNGIVTAPGFDPVDVRIDYAGTAQADLTGSTSAFMEVYAPNANLKLNGGPEYHGSFIGKTLTVGGGVHVHFNEDGESRDRIQRPFRIISWTQRSN